MWLLPTGRLWRAHCVNDTENMQGANKVDNLQKKSTQGVHAVSLREKPPCYKGTKIFYSIENSNIHQWRSVFPKIGEKIGYMISQVALDFQNNKQVAIISKPTFKQCLEISEYNLIYFLVYFAVRHCIEPTWINDRDVFLYPNDKWEKDSEFQNDCLTFTLFHEQNRISASDDVNHWIPFAEREIGAKNNFDSRFMKNFIDGRIEQSKKNIKNKKAKKKNENLFEMQNKNFIPTKPLKFSKEAKEVFEAGKKLWKYYHSSGSYINTNASYYDIRKYFQGVDEKSGRMKNKSLDEEYNKLIKDLRAKMDILASKIEPKIYEYGFLRK